MALAFPFLQLGTAQARSTRRLFEPTDLELEVSGGIELDVQIGTLRSQGPYRLSIPDFELDIGVSRYVEIDIDGALALAGAEEGGFTFGQGRLDPDNVWLAAKIGLLDERDADTGNSWALGVQLGPKLPFARGARGLGLEGLFLGAFHGGGTFITLSAGGLVDPGTDDDGGRPHGFEGGIDIARALDATGRWSVHGQIGGVYFRSDDPQQLAASLGIACAPTEAVEFSVTALGGLLSGSDRYGVLLGIAPKWRLWGARKAATAATSRLATAR